VLHVVNSSIFNAVSDVEIGVTPKPRRGGRWGNAIVPHVM
jgi:hypothetical protein